jgi:hypothetical protein
MPRGFLREAAEGAYLGSPPVVSSGNLASLVAADKGFDVTTEFSPAATVTVKWQSTGALYLPVLLRTGYKYTINVGLAVSGPGVTLSHLFLPRWNRRNATTGVWLAADSAAPVFQTNAIMSCPNNHVNGTSGNAELSNASFLEPSFIPTEDYDAIALAVTCLTGVVAGAMLNNSACWVTVWERSATP